MVAGLLTLLNLLYLPDVYCQWRYTGRSFLRGLQLQVQFWIRTGFPFIMAAYGHQIAFSGAKVQKVNSLEFRVHRQNQDLNYF